MTLLMKAFSLVLFLCCSLVAVLAHTVPSPRAPIFLSVVVEPEPIGEAPTEARARFTPQEVQRAAVDWIATITVIVTALSGLVAFMAAKWAEMKKQVARIDERQEQHGKELIQVALNTPSPLSPVAPVEGGRVGETTTTTTTTSVAATETVPPNQFHTKQQSEAPPHAK